MIKILVLNDINLLDSSIILKIISLMPPERRERAVKMRENPKKENAVCFGLLLYGLKRFYLYNGNVEFFYGKDEKPYLKDGPFFNFSHCENSAVCAFSDAELGVDIQPPSTPSEGVIKRVCTENEKKQLDECGSFSRLWTQKESILKYRAVGISGMKELPDLSAFSDNCTVYSIGDAFLSSYEVGDCSLSVCGEDREVEISEISIDTFSDFVKTVD